MMSTANKLLEDSLNSLASKLGELAASHSSELQPISATLAEIDARSTDITSFKRNLKALAGAVIVVRKSSAPPLLKELPIPPYDLWLPFVAQDANVPVDENLKDAMRIFGEKVNTLVRVFLAPIIPPSSKANNGSSTISGTGVSPTPSNRDLIFISYSHQDQDWLNLLKKHLVPFIRERQKNFDLRESRMLGDGGFWDDTNIKAGEKWRESVKTALERAKAAVLLVTPDFLASDFIANYELPELLRARKDTGVKILWIFVKPCAWDKTPLVEYQSLNPRQKPLATLEGASRDDALLQICREIFTSIEVSGDEMAVDACGA